ncbi:MAG: Ku protein [Rhodanobacteraceae bacterium]
MPRPIWTGTISFGLLNIPVQLMTAERRVDLHFRMLDSRDNTPIRYERVNAETGEEVPWKDIVKAFEYDKGNYVVMDKEDFKKAAPDSSESVDIEAFVDPMQIGPEYFEKPYYLVPTKKAEKGYVLLRETLKRLKTAGLARVVIRTREYLSLVMPDGDALALILLRFPQELVPADEYAFPDKKAAAYRITPKELEMAQSLVESMVSEWNPKDYRDEFRERLSKVIKARVKTHGKTVRAPADEEAKSPEDAATNVVDFMSLLKKSIDSNQRTPAKKRAPAKSAVSKAKKSAPKKKRARKAS